MELLGRQAVATYRIEEFALSRRIHARRSHQTIQPLQVSARLDSGRNISCGYRMNFLQMLVRRGEQIVHPVKQSLRILDLPPVLLFQSSRLLTAAATVIRCPGGIVVTRGEVSNPRSRSAARHISKADGRSLELAGRAASEHMDCNAPA